MEHRSVRAILVSILGVLVLLPAVGFAQTLPDQDIMSLSLEELTKTKVFTASRHLEDTRDAPSAVTIITSEEIRTYGWRTLADVLRSVRGFYAAYDRNYTYLGVRGFLRPGDYNSRLLLLINGHRANDNVYDSAGFGTEFSFDLNLIDHIEIVRGPSSSLFGTNAVFGVVNIITRRAHPGMMLSISGESESYLSRTADVTASLQRGRISGLLSGGFYRSAGADNLYFPEFNSPENNNGIAHRTDGEALGHGFADLQIGSLRIQGSYGSRSKMVPTGSYDAVFNDAFHHTVDSRSYVDASYHRSISNNMDVDVRTYFDSSDSHSYATINVPTVGPFKGVATGQANWMGTEANFDSRVGRQRFNFGASYEYSFNIDQTLYFIGQPPVLDSRRTLGMAAAYGEGEFNVLPKTSIHVGGRLDWFDAFGTALSPRVALVYSPNSDTALKYIYGQAFRAPNAYESYYEDGAVFLAPTAPLKPENIRSHEIVLERNFRPWLLLTAEGFYDNMENLIDVTPDPASGLVHFANHGRDRSRGVEFELQAKQVSGWAARASYSFAETQDQLLQLGLANSPAHLAKLNGTAPLGKKANLGTELLYSSSERSYQGTRVSPWLLTNMTFSTRPLWGGLEFSASCYNLFDRQWASPAGPEQRLADIPQDGRTFRVRMQYTFHQEWSK